MFASFRLIILLLLLSACSRDIMEYPNSNFLRYNPESSAANISNPAMLIDNKPVRLSDLTPKDFKNKDVKEYFNSKHPNSANMPPRTGLGGYPANQPPSANMRNYPAARPNMPVRRSFKPQVTPQQPSNSYSQAQRYYQEGGYPYQVQKPRNSRSPRPTQSNNDYGRNFRQILKPSPIEKYPEITPQYPYKKQYQEAQKADNPYALTQEKRADLGLLDNDYFVPKFKKDYYSNSNNNFRNNQPIEVIEEFDNDILDNMIDNNILDQRFKTKSLPSF